MLEYLASASRRIGLKMNTSITMSENGSFRPMHSTCHDLRCRDVYTQSTAGPPIQSRKVHYVRSFFEG